MARSKRKPPPPGPRIGLDPGSVRIGVAASDPGGQLAVPVATVRRGPGDLDQIAQIAAERDAVLVYVGLPRTLAGAEGAAAQSARAFAGELAVRLAPLRVRLVDERLTTVQASRGMGEAGMDQARQRDRVDREAASVLLQHVLDAERAQGVTVGVPVPLEATR